MLYAAKMLNEPGGIRTRDQQIKSLLLYQLSYGLTQFVSAEPPQRVTPNVSTPLPRAVAGDADNLPAPRPHANVGYR